MKHPFKRQSIVVVLVFALIQSVLVGCAIINPAPATQATMISMTTTPSPMVSAVSQTLSQSMNLTLARLSDECSSYEISPDVIWIVTLCDHNVRVGKIGELQYTILFKYNKYEPYNAYFSPDGKKLALVAYLGPIWLYDVGDWLTPRILYKELQAHSALTWSPDSQSLAVSYLQKGQALSILKLDGTYRNLLTIDDIQSEIGDVFNAFGPSWSPDGNKLAYVTTNDMFHRPPVQLWTVDVASGKKEHLYSGQPGEVGYYPVWSPDGIKIAIQDLLWTPGSLYIYDVKGKTFHLFQKNSGQFGFHWSPDGEHVAICDNFGLSIVSAKSGKSNLINPHCSHPIWKDTKNIIYEIGWNIYMTTLP